MQSIRDLSTQRLAATVAGLTLAVTAGSTIAIAATGGGEKPAPKRLDRAVQDALGGPQVKGVTAKVRFSNHLVDASSLGGGGPILSGATGRFWASDDGRVRLELQSPDGSGDAQAVIDGRRAQLYDPGSNTVYRATLPANREGAPRRETAGKRDRTPGIAQIDEVLSKISRRVALAGPEPGNTAGKPSYSVRATPRSRGGLLGGLSLAWDAAKGVPLRASVYARGSSSPVLELAATHVSYGPVPRSVFSFRPPKGAKVVDMSRGSGHPTDGPRAEKRGGEIRGVAAVRRKVGFPLAAPAELAGRRRSEVRLIHSGRRPAALVTYGRGPGAIAVIESEADGRSGSGPGSKRREGQASLPKVTINGASGQELRTPLGSAIRFKRAGTSYVVLGSVAPGAAEAAARGL